MLVYVVFANVLLAAIVVAMRASTYCFVAGCRADAGSADSVIAPVIVPPDFGSAAAAVADTAVICACNFPNADSTLSAAVMAALVDVLSPASPTPRTSLGNVERRSTMAY
jgi:hypothetical protein